MLVSFVVFVKRFFQTMRRKKYAHTIYFVFFNPLYARNAMTRAARASRT